MPSSRDKRRAGQQWAPVGARLHNDFVDAANLLRGDTYTEALSRYSDGVYIDISSADTIPPGSVIGYGDPYKIVSTQADAQHQIYFRAADPDYGRWAIAQDGAKNGGQAPCKIVGMAWAEVDVTNLGHTHVDWNGTQLGSSDDGPGKIVYSPGAIGVQWLLLQLGCCGQRTTVECPNCINNEAPLRWDITYANVTNNAPQPLGGDAAAAINGTHRITSTTFPCGGETFVDMGLSVADPLIPSIPPGSPMRMRISTSFTNDTIGFPATPYYTYQASVWEVDSGGGGNFLPLVGGGAAVATTKSASQRDCLADEVFATLESSATYFNVSPTDVDIDVI